MAATARASGAVAAYFEARPASPHKVFRLLQVPFDQADHEIHDLPYLMHGDLLGGGAGGSLEA